MYDHHNLMRDSMDDRVLSFHDGSTWRRGKLLAAKPWLGHKTNIDPQFEPSEVHGVFEAEQLKGDRPGLAAIIKIRIEFVMSTKATYRIPISL